MKRNLTKAKMETIRNAPTEFCRTSAFQGGTQTLFSFSLTPNFLMFLSHKTHFIPLAHTLLYARYNSYPFKKWLLSHSFHTKSIIDSQKNLFFIDKNQLTSIKWLPVYENENFLIHNLFDISYRRQHQLLHHLVHFGCVRSMFNVIFVIFRARSESIFFTEMKV